MDSFTVPYRWASDDEVLLATITLSGTRRPGDLARLARVLLRIAPLAEETLDPEPVAALAKAGEASLASLAEVVF